MLNKIKQREEYRNRLAERIGKKDTGTYEDWANSKLLIMLCEILDDHLEQRIKADEQIADQLAVLKDIYAAIDSLKK